MDYRNISVYKPKMSLCKQCRKYPPAPRNWLCGNCLIETRGKDALDPAKIALAHARHQAERANFRPEAGYSVRKVAKSR